MLTFPICLYWSPFYFYNIPTWRELFHTLQYYQSMYLHIYICQARRQKGGYTYLDARVFACNTSLHASSRHHPLMPIFNTYHRVSCRYFTLMLIFGHCALLPPMFFAGFKKRGIGRKTYCGTLGHSGGRVHEGKCGL